MGTEDNDPSEPPEYVWFGVRGVFRWPDGAYEERITIWNAGGLDEAIAMAEAEATNYAGEFGLEDLKLYQAFSIAHSTIEAGAEVFSLLRDSELDGDEYLDRFFDTGGERQQND